MGQFFPASFVIVEVNDLKAFSGFTKCLVGTAINEQENGLAVVCLLYTSPSPRDATLSRMPSSA